MIHLNLVRIADFVGAFEHLVPSDAKVIWELSVKATDKDACELTNRVMGRSTAEFLHYLAKGDIPFGSAKQ